MMCSCRWGFSPVSAFKSSLRPYGLAQGPCQCLFAIHFFSTPVYHIIINTCLASCYVLRSLGLVPRFPSLHVRRVFFCFPFLPLLLSSRLVVVGAVMCLPSFVFSPSHRTTHPHLLSLLSSPRIHFVLPGYAVAVTARLLAAECGKLPSLLCDHVLMI